MQLNWKTFKIKINKPTTKALEVKLKFGIYWVLFPFLDLCGTEVTNNTEW